jgi:hypothetical protein
MEQHSAGRRALEVGSSVHGASCQESVAGPTLCRVVVSMRRRAWIRHARHHYRDSRSQWSASRDILVNSFGKWVKDSCTRSQDGGLALSDAMVCFPWCVPVLSGNREGSRSGSSLPKCPIPPLPVITPAYLGQLCRLSVTARG